MAARAGILRTILRRIDGKGYRAYREVKGHFLVDDLHLIIDTVQGDPFASPSRIRVQIPLALAGFPEEVHATSSRSIALRDFLIRQVGLAIREVGPKHRGTGKSGQIFIDRPGQEILERTAVTLSNGCVEARIAVGLPAYGRRIAGEEAATLLLEEIPDIAQRSLLYSSVDAGSLWHHCSVNEDADTLRRWLPTRDLVAFVADGAILPRESGITDRPLKGPHVVPFYSPPSLQVRVELPHAGTIQGMGIPRGITLIAGGGYHGKSTLLHALERGIYNHIPGDGREYVVTSQKAIKIRAEDGRRVEKVDISPFIDHLPFGQDTRGFSTENASGSTSQAANIMEALEMEADVLLVDEDTSATNFMIRDHRMQELVKKEKEPITPFLDRAIPLFQEYGLSTILVMGGSGDYFDIASTVLCMDEYRPLDCTERARAIAVKYAAERKSEGPPLFGVFRRRIPLAESIHARKGRKEVNITPKGIDILLFGAERIDLLFVEQLVHQSQTAGIGHALHYATRYMDGQKTIAEVIGAVAHDLDTKGLEMLDPRHLRDYAAFRPLELAQAMNRIRTLKVRQKETIDRCC